MCSSLRFYAIAAALLLATAVVVSVVVLVSHHHHHHHHRAASPSTTSLAVLTVNLSEPWRPMPNTLFGIFFEEINHAGSGGLWAELVSNRGFEAGGAHVAADIAPWGVIGDEASILVSTDLSSCFRRNTVALRVEVLKNSPSPVGFYNPGFWGMNIVKGTNYIVTFFLRSAGVVNVTVSFATQDGSDLLATSAIELSGPSRPLNWTRMELVLTPRRSIFSARLQFTTTRKGLLWFDQVSSMPEDTYKGHGFRKDLFTMLSDLKPGFLRFPGGTFVEGGLLRNSFRWKDTVGPWEERPGHFGDVWGYWTDDGLGFFELLLLAEDLDTTPVWVVNCGMSRHEEVNISEVQPFVQEMLDGIEFARGETSSAWGSLRARMGHPKPFPLRYVAIGNEDCDFPTYTGHYLEFYKALKQAYPDIQAISNCDGRTHLLDHPADIFDFHYYYFAHDVLALPHLFDDSPRKGAKVFVSEYAMKTDTGSENLFGALAEAALLIGIEKNSDIVVMACYAPLLVNFMDQKWKPDAVVFNSLSAYGTPSYWMQRFFTSSNGASFLPSLLQSAEPVVASAISWQGANNETYVTVKVVNFANSSVEFRMSFDLDPIFKGLSGVSTTTLSSSNVSDGNSFENPNKVHPLTRTFDSQGKVFNVSLSPKAFESSDFLLMRNETGKHNAR